MNTHEMSERLSIHLHHAMQTSRGERVVCGAAECSSDISSRLRILLLAGLSGRGQGQ